MKRIIDGKRYDTDTATRIADGSLTYRSERKDWTLYRTGKGNWFITVAYSPEVTLLFPKSCEEALRHLEKAGLFDIIEQYFSVEDA